MRSTSQNETTEWWSAPLPGALTVQYGGMFTCFDLDDEDWRARGRRHFRRLQWPGNRLNVTQR